MLMQTLSISYKRHRFPPEIIAHAVWLYVRFNLSLREVEEMLLERGIDVSYSIHSATRNCFADPSRRRTALTIRYHRMEAFETWTTAAYIT